MIFIDNNEILISNFPMPPTTNKQLIFGRNKSRFIKSSEARKFDHEVGIYFLKFEKEFTLMHKKLYVNVVLNEFIVCVTTDFVFPYEKIFTKQAKPKTIDANNRIKSVLDGLAFCTRIDDKYYFEGNYKKIACKNTQNPHVNIRLCFEPINDYVIKTNGTKTSTPVTI